MKNVLELIDSFDQGGSERQAVELTKGLYHSGKYKVHVACLNDHGVLRTELEQIGFHDIPEFKLTRFYNLNGAKQVRRFAQLLRDLNIDVLHTHDFYTNIFGMAAAALARLKAPVASRRESSKRASHKRRVERGAYRVARAVIANCENVREQLIAEGVPQEKIVTIHNGLNTSRFAPRVDFNRAQALARLGLNVDPASKFVCIVANLRPVKDHETFLRAMQLVSKEVPDAAFLLAGEGELLESLQAIAAELGIGDRTFFLGRCRITEDVLALSEVCVLSSISEGFSNSIIEYMAASRPVVATDVGGAREALTDNTGFLVEPGDFRKVAEHVIYLLRHPDVSQAMGQRAQMRATKEFSAARQLKRVEDLYEQLLDLGRPATDI